MSLLQNFPFLYVLPIIQTLFNIKFEYLVVYRHTYNVSGCVNYNTRKIVYVIHLLPLLAKWQVPSRAYVMVCMRRWWIFTTEFEK